ncbi:hypothetical protein GOBAR_AA06937 [Gossypium barbadense]|uniref:Uncharacterized protein n=1 Tax=Gossypium barbadense TaxID=3634 RepID=A0A2P5YDH6_GOSBA|nr:hypothetical protein GOBAR_AA06937 [Gossypium barbadense]
MAPSPTPVANPNRTQTLRHCSSDHRYKSSSSCKYIMSNPRSKKTVIPASKKRKGAASSSGPTSEIRHPFLQFLSGPQEELFQILRARPLGVGCCINWAALEQIQLANVVWALLITDPWWLFFEIVEPTDLVFHLSVPEFRVALGLYTEEFMDNDDFASLHCHIHYSPSNCWKALVPASATYDPRQSKVLALTPSLRYLHAILAHTLIGRYKELQSSLLLRNLQLHWKRFSTTAISYSTTTIAITRYNILLAQDLWTNEPLPPLEYPPPISHLP